jgi:hypothetical protein
LTPGGQRSGWPPFAFHLNPSTDWRLRFDVDSVVGLGKRDRVVIDRRSRPASRADRHTLIVVRSAPQIVGIVIAALGIVSSASRVPPRPAFFDCAGVRLMLSTPEPGFDHPGSILYFAVEDIQQTRDALVSRGVAFRTEPHRIATLADREVWLAEFQDSEGNTLALMSEQKLPASLG